jgi:hypothetical protein
MTKISLRIDDVQFERLKRRAHSAGVSISELLRPAIEHVTDPGRGYIYTSQDEILSGVLQILAITSAGVRRQSPEAFEAGMADARRLLAERGILGAEDVR